MSHSSTRHVSRRVSRSWFPLSWLAALIAAAIVVAGCDQASSPSSSPSQSTPPSSATSSGSPAASGSPAGSPSLTAHWVTPKADATVTSYTLKLSAKIDGSAVTKVRFIVGWSKQSKTACTATKADADGAWACKADLVKLGVAAGPVNLSFKATPADGSAAVGGGKRTVSWAVRPPAPTHVAYKETAIQGATGNQANAKVTITWKEAMTAGVTMHVYALVGCLAPATSTGKPCVTDTSVIPNSALKLLRSVPASKGSTSWTFLHENIGGAIGMYGSDTYDGILLIAENSVGRSHFTVVASSESCYGCVY
jgi:hypothetical protein